MIETEVKIEITPDEVTSIRRKLSEIGAQQISPPLHETNILFDFPDTRLRKRENALRLRQYGEATILTFKGDQVADSAFKKREELESRVEDGAAVHAILEQVGLAPVFRYEKTREKFQLPLHKEMGLICLDETPVGTFVELEGSEDWISQVAGLLGWSRDRFIRKTYIELYGEAGLEE